MTPTPKTESAPPDPYAFVVAAVIKAAWMCGKIQTDTISKLIESEQWADAYVGIAQLAIMIDKIAQTMTGLIDKAEVPDIMTKIMAATQAAKAVDQGFGGAVPVGNDKAVAEAVKQAAAAAGMDATVVTLDPDAGATAQRPPRTAEEQEEIDAVKAALKETFGVDAEIYGLGPNGEIDGRING